MPLLNLKFKKRFSVSVFCGSQFGTDKAYTVEAASLGRLIAKNNMRLVYGAGGMGLMGVVAKEVLKAGGDIYAVTEKVVATWEKPIKETRYRTADTLQKRKLEFLEQSDAFVVLPGGSGTFDEFFDIFTKKYIADRHVKNVARPRYREERPIVLINIGGFYDPMIKLIKASVSKGFMKPSDLNLFTVVKTARAAIALIDRVRRARHGGG